MLPAIEVKSDFQQLDDGKYVTTIEDAESANHIVVFLTGAQAFPDRMGGAVHFCWPDKNGFQSWQYLGAVSNDKPSAVFKISSLKNCAASMEKSPFISAQIPHTSAQIGISTEYSDQLVAMCPAVQVEVARSIGSMSAVERLTARVIQHLVNYMASFARSQGSETYVPLGKLQSWHKLILRRIEQDPKAFIDN